MAAAAVQNSTSRRTCFTLFRALQIRRSIVNTKNLRICGVPACGWPESSSARIVSAKNNPRGSRMGGNRRLSPESSRAAKARASKICEIAIEKRIETADPYVNQTVAPNQKDVNPTDVNLVTGSARLS